MTQLDLFATQRRRRRARKSDPATSRAAALRAPVHEHHARILEALYELGRPATAEQIAARSALTAVQVSRRMAELVDAGAVVVDGTATASSGRPAQCYRRTT